MAALQSISSTQMVTQLRSADWNAKRPNIITNSDYFFCCPDSHHPQIKLCPSSFSDLNNTGETSGVLQWQLIWPFGLLETLINHFVVLYRKKLFSRRKDGHSFHLPLQTANTLNPVNQRSQLREGSAAGSFLWINLLLLLSGEKQIKA